MEKRGQVTIFVIIGISVIAIIGLLLFFFSKNLSPDLTRSFEENQEDFLSQCIYDSLKEKIDIISEQGGYIKPKLKIEFQFQGEEYANISYLCYQQNYYLPCINQEPMFISHLKNEIKTEIKEDLEDCFDELKRGLEKKGYATQIELNDFEVDLRNEKVLIKTESLVKYTKSEDTKIQEDLEFSIVSNFYNLAILVQEITNQEAKFCNFEQTGYMMLYPEFEIEKFRTGDSTTIYTIKYRKTGERFRFAVRSCVIPPGF
jgi:hypothetical protein